MDGDGGVDLGVVVLVKTSEDKANVEEYEHAEVQHMPEIAEMLFHGFKIPLRLPEQIHGHTNHPSKHRPLEPRERAMEWCDDKGRVHG